MRMWWGRAWMPPFPCFGDKTDEGGGLGSAVTQRAAQLIFLSDGGEV